MLPMLASDERDLPPAATNTDVLFDDIDWLYELEPPRAKQLPAKKDRSVERAVDALLVGQQGHRTVDDPGRDFENHGRCRQKDHNKGPQFTRLPAVLAEGMVVLPGWLIFVASVHVTSLELFRQMQWCGGACHFLVHLIRRLLIDLATEFEEHGRCDNLVKQR